MSDNDHVDVDWLRDQIAQGAFDGDLDVIADACNFRKTRLDPAPYLQDLLQVRYEIESVKGESRERRARVGVEANMNIKKILRDAGNVPLVKDFADLLLRRIFVELLGMDPRTIDQHLNQSCETPVQAEPYASDVPVAGGYA